MFGSMDPAKLLVILVIALVVLGPERLPKAARQLGAAWRELTRMRDQVAEEVRSAVPDLAEMDLPRLPRQPGAAVANFVRDLASSDGRAGAELASHQAESTHVTAVVSDDRYEATVAFDDASMN